MTGVQTCALPIYYFEKDAIQNMVSFFHEHKEYDVVRAKVAFRKDTPEKEIIEIR